MNSRALTVPVAVAAGCILMAQIYGGALRAQGAPEGTPTQSPAPPAVEKPPLTVSRIIELIRAGTPPDTLLAMAQERAGQVELTLDDVVRLRKEGAQPELILALVGSAAGGGSPLDAEPPPDKGLAASGSLTVKKAIKMYRQGTPQGEIMAMILREGLKEPADLGELIDYRLEGVPDTLISTLALGGSPTPAPAGTQGAATATPAAVAAPAPATGPMDPDEIARMLQEDAPPDAVVSAIETRGVSHFPTPEETQRLREAGATEPVFAAIVRSGQPAAGPAAAAPPPAASVAPQKAEEPASVKSPRSRDPHAPPLPAGSDRVWVASVPPGARVHVSSARTRRQDMFDEDHYVGRAPLSLTLPAGDYNIVVQKEAGPFEEGLIPAWRTLHDRQDTRSVLDEADLLFDPSACCLPRSLSGTVRVYPIGREQDGAVLGDQFDGLPPYLFDGEALQVLRVRDSRITHSMKLYEIRKNAGQARIVVAAFVPAEGDPLDQAALSGLPDGSPYAAYLDVPALAPLASPEGIDALASALDVDPDRLADAYSMLRRAGKAILHQQVDGGVRLIAIAVDDYGRLRLSDETITPVDLFAEPEPPPKKKKKAPPPPPPPPPLPAVARTVVPGLGMPRLLIDNTTAHAVALMLSDGELHFVPARSKLEAAVDPGTFDARVESAAPGDAPSPRGSLHFSYNARYAITF